MAYKNVTTRRVSTLKSIKSKFKWYIFIFLILIYIIYIAQYFILGYIAYMSFLYFFCFTSLLDFLYYKMPGVSARCPLRSRTEPPPPPPPVWWRARGRGRGPSSAEPSCPSWSRPLLWLPTRTSPWGRGWPRTHTCPRARSRWVCCCAGVFVKLQNSP